MASPGELAKMISEATGVPMATVTDIDRRLAKAKLRSISGRGLNVAQATPLDAARLLTAILASPLATNAVEAVERYAAAVVDPKRSTTGLFAETGIAELAALPERHGFVEAVAALVAAATSGSLAAKRRKTPTLELFAFTRETYGRIRLSGLPGGVAASLEYLRPGTHQSDGGITKTGDLEQSRRITERTIFAVGQLLKETQT